MKLIEVKREYGLNQNTFYGWLRENQMIIKEMTGYVIGPKAFEGMETRTNRRVNDDGEILITTQVIIDNQKSLNYWNSMNPPFTKTLLEPKSWRVSDSELLTVN